MAHGHGSTFWTCGQKYESDYTYFNVASVSTDAGATWTRHELFSGTGYSYLRTICVDPVNPDRVFALGYENSTYILYATEDGGASWQDTVATGYSGTPYDIAVCPSDGNRLAVASYGGLYSSEDGGASWARVTGDFNGAYSLQESTLLSGLLIGTRDEEVWLWENWTGVPVRVGSDLGYPHVSALCEGSDYLYAGTSGNAVWRSYNPTGIAEQYVRPLTEISLVLIPNPVIDAMASAVFTLSVHEQIRLTVYDIAGREVIPTREQMMDPGEQRLNINTSGLSSGLYFVRLESGGTSETVRMVVAR
ncbi:MAG: T9SS type A sorting domain-containing protein [FCB group bacterium]|nr:T9SS type A sorting domain-containing protein [FCB group bacterium]